MSKLPILVCLAFLLTACASPTLTVPPVPTVPTILPVPTRTVAPAPTSTSTAAPTPTRAAPTLLGRLNLRDLPGTGRNPNAIAFVADQVYVANWVTGNVAVIQDDRVVRFIPVGKGAGALAVDPAARRVYVAMAEDKTVALIENDRVVRTADIGERVETIVFFDGVLYVGLASRSAILPLDGQTLEKRGEVIELGDRIGILALAVDPARRQLYANVYEKLIVVDLDARKEIQQIALPGFYFTLATNPARGLVYAGAYESATQKEFLHAFDGGGKEARTRVELGGDPRQAIVDAKGTRIYVANAWSDDVSVIDAASFKEIKRFPVGREPVALTLDENARRLYVANHRADSVTVVDTNDFHVVTTIPLGMQVTALVSDETRGRVYALNASTDSLMLIENNALQKEIPVGRFPVDLARDETSGALYVLNYAERSISVLDENLFTLRASIPLTDRVDSLAVDPTRQKLFVGSYVYDTRSLQLAGSFFAPGVTFPNQIAADTVRVNPTLARLYAIAWNGIPGSNGRYILYAFDEETLAYRGVMGGGNVSAMGIDPETQRVFATSTHPMAYTNWLDVFGTDDKRASTLAFGARTLGLTINPRTHHLFLAHAKSYYYTSAGLQPAPLDNTVEILDTRTLGRVARLEVPGAPSLMTRLGDTIYVVGQDDGVITMLGDAAMPEPPSPTPTLTPTPWPTWTQTPVTIRAPATVTATARVPTPRATPVCADLPGQLSLSLWAGEIAARLGCPVAPEHFSDFAVQTFEGGRMFWRGDVKKIFVLYPSNTLTVFDDRWDGKREDSCPEITAAGIKPKRGFGLVWCTQPDVRAKLGSALEEERGYSDRVQDFQNGAVWGFDQSTQTFILFNDGTWQ